jgi:broad-specificity NMP kinase
LVEAVEMCPRVDEIDTTGRSAEAVAGMIGDIIEGRLHLPPGQVDWLEEFLGR